jgi:hypothetical protein
MASQFTFDPDLDEPAPLEFLREYWQRQRGQGAMPRRQDISPAQMKTHLPNILLVDVVLGGEDFRYRVVGSELQRYFKSNPTAKLMTEALIPFGADTTKRTLETYRTVLARRAPLRVRGAGELYDQTAKYFDALLTPLSDDGVEANMILGSFVFGWDFEVAQALPGIVEPDEVALARALYAGK